MKGHRRRLTRRAKEGQGVAPPTLIPKNPPAQALDAAARMPAPKNPPTEDSTDKRRRNRRTGAGLRSVEKETYQWGPRERNRMADMAVWTKKYPGRDNPHTREKIYSQEERDRADKFEDWHQANPHRPHSENIHRWQSKASGKILPAILPYARLNETEVEEGERQDKRTKFRKRNKKIIEDRKYHDTHTCQACGFSLTVNNVHVIDCHHLNPLSESDDSRVTKNEDLVCLCPTCHRIAHTRRRPPLSVEEIQAELFRGGMLGDRVGTVA